MHSGAATLKCDTFLDFPGVAGTSQDLPRRCSLVYSGAKTPKCDTFPDFLGFLGTSQDLPGRRSLVVQAARACGFSCAGRAVFLLGTSCADRGFVVQAVFAVK